MGNQAYTFLGLLEIFEKGFSEPDVPFEEPICLLELVVFSDVLQAFIPLVSVVFSFRVVLLMSIFHVPSFILDPAGIWLGSKFR